MIVGDYDVPNTLILNYCRIIKLIEDGTNEQLDHAREALHNEIFEVVGCDRSLYRREDRKFSTALNNTVIELLENLED